MQAIICTHVFRRLRQHPHTSDQHTHKHVCVGVDEGFQACCYPNTVYVLGVCLSCGWGHKTCESLTATPLFGLPPHFPTLFQCVCVCVCRPSLFRLLYKRLKVLSWNANFRKSDRNIKTLTSDTDTRGPRGRNQTDFCEPLTFHVGPPWGGQCAVEMSRQLWDGLPRSIVETFVVPRGREIITTVIMWLQLKTLLCLKAASPELLAGAGTFNGFGFIYLGPSMMICIIMN